MCRQPDKQACHKNGSASRIGFTLAEVLIVITIIGVIASLTIPDLIQNTQTQQWKAAYKKNFAMLSQATLQIKEDNGGSMVNAFEAIPFDGWSDFDKLPATYEKYMHVIKTCRKWSTVGQCVPSFWSYLNGNPAVGTGITQTDFLNITGGFAGALLNDGTSLGFSYLSGACTSTSWITNNICGYIMIDINGFKNPNVWGKDIYGVYILKNGNLKPFGISTDEARNTTCIQGNTNATNLGLKCSFDYLTQ